MPSLKKDATTGALLKNSSGALVDVCGAGCTASGTSCTHCDDTTPSQYTVTFSSVTLCGCYLNDNAGVDVDVSYKGGFDLNAAFTLSQDSSCIWSYTEEDAVEYVEHTTDDESCGAVSRTTSVDVEIELERSGTTWELRVLLVAPPVGNDELFRDTQNGDTDGGGQLCATVPSFTNDATVSGDCGSVVGFGVEVAAGYDGTATVVCV